MVRGQVFSIAGDLRADDGASCKRQPYCQSAADGFNPRRSFSCAFDWLAIDQLGDATAGIAFFSLIMKEARPMRAVFVVDFVVGADYGGSAQLETDLPFVPTLDIEFGHSVWDEARRPTCVTYDVEQGSFSIYFGLDELDSESQLEDSSGMYRQHGWDVKACIWTK